MLVDLVPRLTGNVVDTIQIPHEAQPQAVSSVTAGRIARVFFTVSGRTVVLLRGFIKKTRATPVKELGLASRRMKVYVSNERRNSANWIDA